jgi:hypothetical protein
MRRRQLWIGALVLALLAAGQGHAAEGGCGKPSEDCFLKRLGPVGGWNPYGGGLLHWWNPCCFCGGAADDYCRKPLPQICWPAYTSYYIRGPQEICCPKGNGRPDCHKAH